VDLAPICNRSQWKPEAKLAKLSQEKPNRYVRLDDGRWRCPPGEAYAAAFGSFYRLRSSEELNPLLVRNLVFLGDYLRDVWSQKDFAGYSSRSFQIHKTIWYFEVATP